MSFVIVGLGNPGAEYAGTRHNAGRMMVESLAAEHAGEFEFDKKLKSLTAEIKVGKEKVRLLAPDTFMNNSGKAVAPLVKSVKAAGKLLVIYDDFNLPLGRIKISYDRSSGGHNGLESVIKAIKTQAFSRIRVGTAPSNAKGQAKVPHGEEKVEKFILGHFKEDEKKTLKKVAQTVAQAAELVVREGYEKAMSVYNAA